MNIGEEQKCRSKYSSNNYEYNCLKEDENNIKIYKDEFSVTVTPGMFNSLFEII